MNFIGFTYKGDVELERAKLVNVLKELDSVIDSTLEERDCEAKIQNVKVQSQLSHREMANPGTGMSK